MTEAATLSRRSLLRGAGAEPARRWRAVDGVSGGSGDVFWCGWADGEGVFVGGDDGRILHWDGAGWADMETPVSAPVHAFWGRSRDALWAVGWMGSILRFDGAAWRRVRGCVVNAEGRYAAVPENTPLFAIDGDAEAAWAVGDDGTILRLDGEGWVTESSGVRAHLRCVRALSDGRVLAAGGDGTVLIRDAGVWSRLDCPIGATFVAALEDGEGRVLLAGGRYFMQDNGFRGDLALVEDGVVTPVALDAPARRFRDLALTGEGVVAVGDGGEIHLLRDGRLRRVESATRHDLHGVVPLPGGGALAVGDFGTVLEGDPEALVRAAPAVRAGPAASLWSPMESGTDRQLWGLWTDPESGAAYACGEEGVVLTLDRGRWERLPPLGEIGVHAMARAPDGGLLAAGQLGEIHAFDGAVWRKAFDLMMDVTILSLWSDGAGALVAAGDEGLILRWDGAEWRRASSGTRSALYGLWGLDADHMLAVGDFGLVLRWNGRSWDPFEAGTEHFLFDVWGRALDDIHVVGMSGTIGHFDGTRWRITPARARHDLLAIAGTDSAAMAVGAGGAAMLRAGGTWAPDPTGVESGLRAVTALADGRFLAAGDGGRILLREVIDGGLQAVAPQDA